MRSRVRSYEWAALALITAGAAVLRLIAIGKVAPDPFYDAAVRSMGISWHNFFFGAFEPGGSVSIDKPPVDLWLQVASVKLFGFSATTLKLPEAFAGIAAVPLLFVAVRRMWSATAGLAAAAALALLPVDVITSRSDTMDGVMMVLIVLALVFFVRACETGRTRWLLAGAAALGVAFDVKILESLVALPGLALLALIGFPGTLGKRALKLAAAGAVYVVVGLAWLTATLFVPAHSRPWAIGSTNGSAWNVTFVFNGTDRLGGKSPEAQTTVYEPGHKYPVATQSERDHIPILPPSPTRLLARIGPLSGQRLGLELLEALLLGIPALLWSLGLRRRRRRDLAPGGVAEERTEASAPASGHPQQGKRPAQQSERAAQTAPGHEPRRGESDERRVRLAVAAGLGLWLLTGIALFSDMARLHPRYVEGLVPAVAATLGIGIAWASQPRGLLRPGVLVVALAATIYYAERLMYGTPTVWWIAFLAAIAALLAAALARARMLPARLRAVLAPGVVLVLSLCAMLALSLNTDIRAIQDHVTDAGEVGALPGEELEPLSKYLRANQRGARYEVAAQSATQIGALIVRDGRPVVVLTSYGARVFTTTAQLERLIAKGEVRYAFLNSPCPHHISPNNPACSPPAKWIRAHGTDVSRAAKLRRGKTLWLLPGAAK
ncbi:MAG TPA: glycosyltransferase family 39 protein [Solirubrobacteraceae bacterium]|jgi:4-amino-4-deoxy-L-arabinose transferase-like glycosyltransferase|nr:glycosyltransferase family 39 protein [Solirubrobacteraceae bacterium]